MFSRRSFLWLVVLTIVFFGHVAESGAATTVYSVKRILTSQGIEYRCYYLTHHFLSVLMLNNGCLAVRPHPSSAPDDWGVTKYEGVALSSGQPSRTSTCAVMPGTSGVTVVASGKVDRGGGLTYGTWNTRLLFSFAPKTPAVLGSGNTSVSLTGTLAAVQRDLVVGRLANNYLHLVPFQGSNTVGNTGDMKHGIIRYSAVASTPKDFVWLPYQQPAHYPNDRSSFLSIHLVGDTNRVDTLKLGAGFQIKVAKKPSLNVSITSPDDGLSAGLFYDTSKSKRFEADNVGASHLILRGGRALTRYGFDIKMTSVP